MEYFEFLKVAHDKFTCNGKKYHAQVDMVDTAGKKVWLWGLDARVNHTLSTRLQARKALKQTNNVERCKSTMLSKTICQNAT